MPDRFVASRACRRWSSAAAVVAGLGIALSGAGCDRPAAPATADVAAAPRSVTGSDDLRSEAVDTPSRPAARASLERPPGEVGRPVPADTGRSPAPAPAPVALPPLLAADGTPLPPSPEAVPRDGAAMTLDRHYATAAQAEALAATLQGRVVWVDVGPGAMGIDAIDLGVLVAYGQQAAHDLPDDAPILVRGADLRTAARVVDRLCGHGRRRVFLVTTP